MEDAYKKIMKGDWEQKDFDVVWQTIKPFIQTQTELDTKVELVS